MSAKEEIEFLQNVVKQHIEHIADIDSHITELMIERQKSRKDLHHFQERLAAELSQVSA